MSNLLKIVVTDSGGDEHIFNENTGEVENYLCLKDENGFVTVTTRTFEHEEVVTTFISPRRVDVIYGAHSDKQRDAA